MKEGKVGGQLRPDQGGQFTADSPDLLTRCKEVSDYYSYLCVTPQDVKDATFSARDFEYYLTDDKQDAEKYYVTAFWKEEEKEEGLEWLKRWRMYVEDATEMAGKE